MKTVLRPVFNQRHLGNAMKDIRDKQAKWYGVFLLIFTPLIFLYSYIEVSREMKLLGAEIFIWEIIFVTDVSSKSIKNPSKSIDHGLSQPQPASDSLRQPQPERVDIDEREQKTPQNPERSGH